MKNFQKGSGTNEITYPLTQEQLDNLQDCDLVNPKVGNDYGLKIPDNWNQQEAADEILKIRLQVLNDVYPRWFMEKYWFYNFPIPNYLPKALEINDLSFDRPKDLAQIVHMDDPLDLPLSMKKVLTNPRYGGDANIKNWTSQYKQFLETVVDVNETITDYQKRYGHRIFEVKYALGIGRPEEVLDGLFSPSELTAYPEGCPNHPSIGQGHLALSQAGILALHKSYDLTEEQIKDMLYTSYLWGQFRCLAGVHYGIDAVISALAVGGFNKYLNDDYVDQFRKQNC